MIPVDQMTDEQLERHALEILRRELGLQAFARFVRAFRSGAGDYCAERHQWLEQLAVREVAKDLGELPPGEHQSS